MHINLKGKSAPQFLFRPILKKKTEFMDRHYLSVGILPKFGVSWENKFFKLGADYNYFDYDALESQYTFVPRHSTWDLYNVSSGIEWEKDKFNLTAGLNVSLGLSNNQMQVFNLSNPKDYNYLVGELSNSVNSRYIRVVVLIGFTYYFLRI